MDTFLIFLSVTVIKPFHRLDCCVQSAAAARERSSTDEVSASASQALSAGGRWWLQNWFPAWSGWYGGQELTESTSLPAAAETPPANSDTEKALGNNTLPYYLPYSFLYIISQSITVSVSQSISIFVVTELLQG